MSRGKLALLALALTTVVVGVSWERSDRKLAKESSAAVPSGVANPSTVESPAVLGAPEIAPARAGASVPRTRVSRLEGLNLAANLESLKEQAKRDPQLAYELARALLHCTMADAAYEQMSGDLGKARVAKSAEKTLTEMESVYGKCDGLKGDHSELRFDLAGQAGRAGILEAMREYRGLAAGFVVSEAALKRPTAAAEFSQNVRNFTDRAAQTGDPAALYNAYAFYSDGMLVKPDLVRAHQYLSRFNRAKPSVFAPAALADLEKKMTPQQLREATRAR